ncbi:cytochrome ubiquinol oxidase subunit I, partial [Cribrihabitans sp. XS_ASV171]
GLSSLLVKYDVNAPRRGLDTVPDDEEPPVAIVFWSFRVMVGLGLAMLALGLWALWARWRGTLYSARWLHRASVALGPAGFVAVLAGWVTTEVGRQPYTVYGYLRTADSLSPVEAPAVSSSLTAFIIVYFFIFGAGTFYLLRLMSRAPGQSQQQGPSGPIRGASLAGVTRTGTRE